MSSRYMRFWAYACLALVAGAGCSRSTDQAASGAPGNPPERVARLAALDGTVGLQAPGADTWQRGTTNYPITTGYRLDTGAGSRAEMDLGSAAFRLGDAS